MQLFWMEVKKVFSWKILALIFFVNVLLYLLLFEFHIEYFPNGRPAGDFFKIEQQMIDKYGIGMNEEEYQDFVLEYEREIEKANEYLQNDPQSVALGLTTYELFRNRDHNDPKKNDYGNLVMHDRKENLFWELQARESLIEYYDHRIVSLKASIEGESGVLQQRFEQLLREEKYGVYSNVVPDNFIEIKRSMTIIVFISIAILISPIYLRDQLTSIVPLQYSSKRGRVLYRTKWLAGLVSTALTTILLLTFYLSLYATNDTSNYFDVPMYTFVTGSYWYDITLFQYIALSVAAIFVVAMLLGILTMAISTLVRNTIVLVGIQIVVMFGMIAGASTFMVADIISIWHPKWLVPTCYILLSVFISILARFVWRRELRRDVV